MGSLTIPPPFTNQTTPLLVLGPDYALLHCPALHSQLTARHFHTKKIHLQVVIGGATELVCGTSCSSPSVAGMTSLINAIRVEAGASSVGFINPALYQNYSTSSMFNDITSGENQCTAEVSV